MIKDSVLFTNKELGKFCTYRLVFGVSYSIMIPIIPLFFKNLGLTTVMIGTVMSSYGISKTIAQIPFGVVSDKLGDKLTVVFALILMSIVPFLYTLTNNPSYASYIYIIQGGILGMAAPATYSILARSVEDKRRGESTGLASAVFTLGGGIGSCIGGYVVAILGNYRLAFYISSFGIVLTLIYVIFKIKSIKSIKHSKIEEKHSLKEVFIEIKKYKLTYKIIVLGSIAFLGDYIYGCVVALIHFYSTDVLNSTIAYSSAIISIYLIVFGIGAPIAGWVSDKIGNKKQLFIAFTVMNITLFALSFTRNILFFTLAIIIYFLGATFLNASLQSSLSEFGDNKKIKGIVFGFVGASESFGYAVGPFFSAYIYNINKSWLFLGLLGVSLIVSIIYLLLHKKAGI
ncbi:MFS transporter [Romboutsia sp.]|uniref:MFS transporter n=1 Tax=Romboutsia sp. TaxID=1965302 RepID=UPI003F41A9A6